MKPGCSAECAGYGHHRLSGVRAHIQLDVQRYLINYPGVAESGISFKMFLSVTLTPEILSVALYRLSHFLYLNGRFRTARAVALLNFFVHKTFLPPETCIGPGCHIPHPAGVVFCGTAGSDLSLYSTAVCSPDVCLTDGPANAGPKLGDRVTVGAHAVLLGPVQVGNDTNIGFSVRLTKSVPPRSIVLSWTPRSSTHDVAVEQGAAESPAR